MAEDDDDDDGGGRNREAAAGERLGSIELRPLGMDDMKNALKKAQPSAVVGDKYRERVALERRQTEVSAPADAAEALAQVFQAMLSQAASSNPAPP
mmetsp:Transcript_6692/g.14307  ORF Transcript_6692/g.14307 Transcript_6692/m.14307 type:complete len:96 (-) Transcript_6692:766-1053(-)